MSKNQELNSWIEKNKIESYLSDTALIKLKNKYNSFDFEKENKIDKLRNNYIKLKSDLQDKILETENKYIQEKNQILKEYTSKVQAIQKPDETIDAVMKDFKERKEKELEELQNTYSSLDNDLEEKILQLEPEYAKKKFDFLEENYELVKKIEELSKDEKYFYDMDNLNFILENNNASYGFKLEKLSDLLITYYDKSQNMPVSELKYTLDERINNNEEDKNKIKTIKEFHSLLVQLEDVPEIRKRIEDNKNFFHKKAYKKFDKATELLIKKEKKPKLDNCKSILEERLKTIKLDKMIQELKKFQKDLKPKKPPENLTKEKLREYYGQELNDFINNIIDFYRTSDEKFMDEDNSSMELRYHVRDVMSKKYSELVNGSITLNKRGIKYYLNEEALECEEEYPSDLKHPARINFLLNANQKLQELELIYSNKDKLFYNKFEKENQELEDEEFKRYTDEDDLWLDFVNTSSKYFYDLPLNIQDEVITTITKGWIKLANVFNFYKDFNDSQKLSKEMKISRNEHYKDMYEFMARDLISRLDRITDAKFNPKYKKPLPESCEAIENLPNLEEKWLEQDELIENQELKSPINDLFNPIAITRANLQPGISAHGDPSDLVEKQVEKNEEKSKISSKDLLLSRFNQQNIEPKTEEELTTLSDEVIKRKRIMAEQAKNNFIKNLKDIKDNWAIKHI